MRKATLTKVKYISLVILAGMIGVNIVFIFYAQETPAQVSASPYTGSVIYIQPLGDVESGKLDVVEGILRDNFKNRIQILPPQKLLRSHQVRSRDQYDASELMDWAKTRIPGDAFRYIALLDEDIFSGRYNFIFGQAQLPGKVSVISLARFAETGRDLQPPEKNLFTRRLTGLVLHELGHTFGLAHCHNAKCVMRFANSMIELDNQSIHYCPECLERLRWVGVLDIFTGDGDAVTYLQAGPLTGEPNGRTIR